MGKEFLYDLLTKIAQQSPMVVVLFLAVWYLHNQVKKLRKKIDDLQEERIADIKEINRSQNAVNSLVKKLIKDLDDGE